MKLKPFTFNKTGPENLLKPIPHNFLNFNAVNKYSNRQLILVVAVFAIFLGACKKKEVAATKEDPNSTYFSIKQYELDQWNTWAGEPFTIVKTVTINKKVDSSYTNSDTISWAPIFRAFAETDISDPKFQGQYNINSFDDPQDGTHNLFYQAKEDNDDLFTRKLLITIDEETMRIKGIYIETFKKYFGGEKTEKLYYAPMQTIQIQTDDKPVLGSRKLTVTEWSFMR